MTGPGPIALLVLSAAAVVPGCTGRPPAPATLDTRNDACHNCRMSVSDARFAAQIVAPGEEPMFFDDIGCLAVFLSRRPPGAKGSIAYVADHRTRAWVPAARAVYTRVPRLATPMSSHLVAHGDDVSRLADEDAMGGEPMSLTQVYGDVVPPGAAAPEASEPGHSRGAGEPHR